MKKHNWDEISEAQEYERPTPGAYIAQIINVEDVEEKEYLRIEWDFMEGKYKGYYADLYNSRQFWGGVLIRSYKEKALPFFKAFKTSLEASNRGYFFDEDRLSDMRGKMIGIVLGEEEYRANDGTVKTRTYVAQVRSIKAIQDGDFKVPELKKLAATNTSTGISANASGWAEIEEDGELPF